MPPDAPASPVNADQRLALAGRIPLSQRELQAALIRPGSLWREVRVTESTGSTNADLIAHARRGGAEGTVLAAEAQVAGRGRLGRRWVSPPRAGLAFSVLLRPAAVPVAARGWLPLLAGLAVAAAVRAESSVNALLKWPNDVLAGGRKLAGILAEQAAGAVVIGIGLNVSATRAELPVPQATSLALETAASPDRNRLLAGILRELESRYRMLADHGGADRRMAAGPGAAAPHAPLRAEYLDRCCTLGREVQVMMPGDRVIAGTAADVDEAGRLVVATAAGAVPVSAGDVVHVR
jgi:BirA family biotin operon repressor/biotin-[acetyl-CoA-carboxylase] ligase